MDWYQRGRPSRGGRRLALLAAGVTLALAGGPAGPAQAGRVVTKGVALEGTVKSLSSEELVLQPIYGEGTLAIPLEDVESLETEGVFHIVHGDDVHTVGTVTGLTADALLVRTESGEVVVPFDSIRSAALDPGADANLLQRMDVLFPYWTGSFELAFAATQATDDSLSFSTALDLERERGRHRSVFGARYRLGTQQPAGEDEDTTANELYGRLRHEYGFAERWFAYGSVDGEYDEVESLSLRTVPKTGLGYELFRSEEAWLTVDGGFAYVYERFFGGEVNQYPGLAFGAESDWELPFGGAVWHNRVDYTPSLEEPFDDFLLRAETSLEMPLWEELSFTASVIDTYDSTPAEGSDRNSLSTLVGLAYGF